MDIENMTNELSNIDNPNILFSDIFDLEEIQRMQDLFSEATGVASLITLPNGTPITEPSNFSRFCQLIRATEKGFINCKHSDMFIGGKIDFSKDSELTPCLSAGLWDTGAKITVGNVHIANWMIGQVRNKDADEKKLLEYGDEVGVDKTDLKNALKEVTTMSAEKFRKISEMLVVFANQLSEKAYSNYLLKNQINEIEKANELLQKSEEKYRTIFENVQDVFYQVDLINGVISEVSPSIRNYSNYERNELIGRSVSDFYFSRADRDLFISELFKTGQLNDYELAINNGRSEIIHTSVSARVVLDENGLPTKVEGFLRDISKRKKAEKLLKESELKFRNYIGFAPHAVFIANENGKYIEVNPAAARVTGYSVDELILMDQLQLIAPESHSDFRVHFETVSRIGIAHDEFALISKDNIKKYVAVDTVRLSENKCLGFIIDITHSKNTEEILTNSEARLLEAQSIARLGNCSIDLIKGVWISSEVLDAILGVNSDFEKTNAGWKKIVHPDWFDNILRIINIKIESKEAKLDLKFKIIRQSDLEVRWVHAIGKIKYGINNEVEQIIATLQDITDRKKATEALRESEALYRSTLNASPDAIVVVNMDGRIQMVSPSATKLYLFDNEEQLLGKNMFEFFHSDDIKRAQSNMALMFKNQKGTVEYSMLRSTAEVFQAEINGDIIFDSRGHITGMVFIIRDITERKNAELALNSSREQLKEFAAHLQDVREEERVVLAREIHDELGQILVALKIDLGLLNQKVSKTLSGGTEVDVILADFVNLFVLVDGTIKATRKIMTDLRSEVLDLLGFADAAKLYINNFQERYKIQCNFNNATSELLLNSQQAIALYRILQESLSNVAKHSQSPVVDIHLSQQNDNLVFEIIDYGVGFNKNIKSKPDSYGLMGIKERVFLLDGELTITSEIDKGTALKIKMPNKMTKK